MRIWKNYSRDWTGTRNSENSTAKNNRRALTEARQPRNGSLKRERIPPAPKHNRPGRFCRGEPLLTLFRENLIVVRGGKIWLFARQKLARKGAKSSTEVACLCLKTIGRKGGKYLEALTRSRDLTHAFGQCQVYLKYMEVPIHVIYSPRKSPLRITRGRKKNHCRTAKSPSGNTSHSMAGYRAHSNCVSEKAAEL